MYIMFKRCGLYVSSDEEGRHTAVELSTHRPGVLSSKQPTSPVRPKSPVAAKRKHETTQQLPSVASSDTQAMAASSSISDVGTPAPVC